MARWHGPRGIEIEVILLDSGPLMKVTQHVNGRHYLLGYCATIADVSTWTSPTSSKSSL